LAEELVRRHAERGGMLGAEHRAIGVVVDRNQLRTPEQDDLRLGRQQNTDRAAQALRPALNRAERCGRPLFFADEGAHFTAPYQPIRCQGPQLACGWTSHYWQAAGRFKWARESGRGE